MNEERQLIKSFVENKPLFEAVKRIILSGIFEQGTGENIGRNWVLNVDMAMDDEKYGQFIKARAIGQALVEQSFNAMTQMAVPPSTNDGLNQAR